MSGYGDDYRDYQQRMWMNEWVPRAERTHEITPDQYYFILAQKREIEHKYKELQEAVGCLRKLVNG